MHSFRNVQLTKLIIISIIFITYGLNMSCNSSFKYRNVKRSDSLLNLQVNEVVAMVLYIGKLIQMISFALCLIRVGVGAEFKILETVKEVLNEFNTPLKLTITTCWDAGIRIAERFLLFQKCAKIF